MADREWNRPYKLYDSEDFVKFGQLPKITLAPGIEIRVCGLPLGCVGRDRSEGSEAQAGCQKMRVALSEAGNYYLAWKKQFHKDFFKDVEVLADGDMWGNRAVLDGANGDNVKFGYRVSWFYRGETDNGYPVVIDKWRACPPECRGSKPEEGKWEFESAKTSEGGVTFVVRRVDLPPSQ